MRSAPTRHNIVGNSRQHTLQDEGTCDRLSGRAQQYSNTDGVQASMLLKVSTWPYWTVPYVCLKVPQHHMILIIKITLFCFSWSGFGPSPSRIMKIIQIIIILFIRRHYFYHFSNNNYYIFGMSRGCGPPPPSDKVEKEHQHYKHILFVKFEVLLCARSE